MDAITTIGLTKQYKEPRAVDNLCLNIPRGSVCGFLGRNGAGKMTAIRMLVGLARPSSGKIVLHGQERIYGKNNNSDIGYLPDVPSFYGYLTAREYLDFCGRLYGMEKGKPKTIFLDEPISALDPIGRYEIMELIRSLRGNVTVFFSTHILVDVESTCDYAVIMDRGKVMEAGSIEEIKKKYTGNSVRVKFCSQDDCQRMMQTLVYSSDMSYEKYSNTELKITGADMLALGKKFPASWQNPGQG